MLSLSLPSQSLIMLPRVTILPAIHHPYPANFVQAVWSFQLRGRFGWILFRDVKVSVSTRSRRAYALTLAMDYIQELEYMTRRFSESQLVGSHSVATPATPCLPGFMACNTSSVNTPIQQLWHAIYQAAYAQAVVKAFEDTQPSRYDRLLYHVCLN